MTVTTTGNHNISGNSFGLPNGDGTYMIQFPAQGNSAYIPAATQPNGNDTLAVRATVTGATTFTYPLTSGDPGTFKGSVTAMSWNAGTHVVTVSITTSVALPTGSTITLAGMDASWSPTGSVPFDVSVTGGSTSNFTYAGPSSFS